MSPRPSWRQPDCLRRLRSTGVTQEPLHGVSMSYSFDDAAAAEQHATQYFEMFCDRGIYHQGWSAVTKHRAVGSWDRQGQGSPSTCGSCTSADDWTQAHDLAAEQPAKLAELRQLFLLEAA